MWANTVWGFAGLSFTSFLAGLLSTSDPHLKAWLYYSAIIFGACGLFVLVWPTLKRFMDQLSGKPSTLDVTTDYDMPIAKAIDYIVNDSTQKLKQPSPPRIYDSGPAKGHLYLWSEKGVQHSDAFRLVSEKVISGKLQIWGRRECLPIKINTSFEGILREINIGYWQNGHLVDLMCFHETTSSPQTGVSNITDVRYTGLMLNTLQVRHLWKPKAPLFKFFERKILRRPRLSYWPAPEALSTK